MNTYYNITNCFDYDNRQINKNSSTFLFINLNLFIKLAYRMHSHTRIPATRVPSVTLYKYKPHYTTNY